MILVETFQETPLATGNTTLKLVLRYSQQKEKLKLVRKQTVPSFPPSNYPLLFLN